MPLFFQPTIHRFCGRGKKRKSMKASEWKWYRLRIGIEPIIGHAKQDHRMDRNYLKGEDGDKINAILAAGCGFNIRKLLRAILLWLFKERFRVVNALRGGHQKSDSVWLCLGDYRHNA